MLTRSLIAIIFLSTFFLPHNPAISQDEKIIAQVGNLTLTEAEFALMLEALPPQYQSLIETMPEIRTNLISGWVDTALLSQEAVASGLSKKPMVAMKLREMRNRVLVESMINDRMDVQTPVAEDQVKKYYNDHPEEFHQEARVQAQHILIIVDETASAEDEEKAKATISKIQKEISAGKPFAELATSYSEDPGSKANGGDLGYFSRDEMVQEFAEAAFATEVGKVSKPVRTGYGWHLIKVSDRAEATIMPYAEIAAQIQEMLKNEQNKKELNELLTSLRQKFPVTITGEKKDQPTP